MFKLFLFLIWSGEFYELDLEADYLYDTWADCAHVAKQIVEYTRAEIESSDAKVIWICELDSLDHTH